jgi:putative phosphoesterase
MKILVASDSHGNTQALLDAVFDVSPQLVLHLGDGERDCDKLRGVYPDLTVRAVRGNCDLRSREPDYDEFVVENKRIFMTHGHMYGVKTGLDSVLNAGFLRSADILLFGHTHRAFREELDGMLVLNPGSIGLGAKTYTVLDIEHGAVKCTLAGLEP